MADLIALAIGTGPLQIGTVVALAMAAAILLGGGSLIITEAGVAALLAVTLEPSTQGLSPDRFLDALVGSGVALAISALFPNDPRRMVEQATYPIIDQLIVMLGETTVALHTDDVKLAEQALEKARELRAPVRLTGPCSTTISASWRCSITPSSCVCVQKHRSAEPGVGAAALGSNSRPASCRLIFCVAKTSEDPG